MKGSECEGVPPRRRSGCFLVFLLLLVLFGFLLPGLLKRAMNVVLLPRAMSHPKIPLVEGSVQTLSYTEFMAEDWVVDAGDGLLIQIPRLKAIYTPVSLMRGRVQSVDARLTSESEVPFEADVSMQDLRVFSEGVEAQISAQCSRVECGAFSAGPFHAATEISGKEAALAFEVPLQEGLLTADVAFLADWRTNSSWHGTVRVPLRAADGSAVLWTELSPAVEELLVLGEMVAEVSGDSSGTVARVSLEVESLDVPPVELSLRNLKTSCTLHFPGEVRSQPEQVLTVESLAVGTLQLDQIEMHYQLEPDSVFFIESLMLNWCGGRVSLFDTRIFPDAATVSARLFCDRLSLEQVMVACGLDGFSAGGELNGRLPILWSEEGLRVDQGFLFTTPGRGGIFSFGAAEAAAGILPPGSLESGQVGLVTAALAEFKYDWITMTVTSEGDSLLAVVEMSGTPENVLPYEYDSKKGTYVKVALRPGRGIRQPMQFKLNLTVPLNQLLCYASGINRQWNLFKGTGK